MANIQINQLPTAGAITGQELVPVQQNGVTVQTTTAAISASPSQTQTFLTVGVQPTLPNSRYFSAGIGLGIADGGAQGAYTISFNGTAYSLELVGVGVIVKTAANTIAARTLATSGNGISVTDGDGIAGNPTFQLTGLAQAIANASGTGILALNGSSTISPVTITGTGNQIGVTGGDGSSTPTISLANNFIAPGTAGITLPNGTTAQRGATTGQIRYNTTTARFEGYYAGSWQNFGLGDGTLTSVSGTTNQINVSNVGSIATVALSSDPIVPGTGGVTLPVGTTAQRSAAPINGILRYNTTTATFEGYANGVWGAIISGSGVTSIATGTGLTGGPITSTGTIAIANTAVTAAAYGSSYQVPTFTVNAQGQLTLAANTTIDAVTLTTGSITTAPSGANDIANKSYVDSIAQGLDPKASCVAATTANITLSGTQTIDGVALIAGDRCLVKNQTLSQNNGIYLVAAGAWTRAADMDTWAKLPGAFTFIEQGTLYADTGWVCTSNAGGTLGTTPITWVQFAGVGSYTAGTGLTLTGTQFSLTAPVAIALGGTNATNATDARTNLVAAKSGTNNDITELNALNGTSYGVAYQNLTNQLVMGAVLTFDGTTLAAPDASFSTLTALLTNSTGLPLTTGVTGTLPIANGGTNSTATPTNGGVGYGTGTAYAFSAAGTSSEVLISAGAASPTWASQSSLAVGTSTNLAGGATGSLPYQSGAGATAMLAAGTNGYLLTLTAGLPSWQPAPASGVTTFSAGTTGLTPSTATSGAVTLAGTLALANGGTNASLTAVAGAVPYSSASALALTAAGTAGQVLTSNGASAPTWTTPAGGVTLSNDTATSTNLYPTFANATSGSVSTIYTGNARLLYKPSTGELQSTALVASNGIVVNSATVNENYTIPSGSNAMSAGPITVASGIVVTVPSGSTWVIS